MYENEIWKQIDDLPYEVSNYGRIKSHIVNKGNKTAIIKGTVSKNGYRFVSLYRKKEYVHRLVAYYFVIGFREGLHVNHIDGNKLNNHFSNLEWITNEDNVKHAWANGLTSGRGKGRPCTEEEKEHKKATSPLRKMVLNNSTGETFRSCRELARQLDVDNGTLARKIREARKHNGILYTYI